MKALRYTMFSPDLEAISPIVRDIDMSIPLEKVSPHQPGCFGVHDLFEVDDDLPYEEVMMIGVARQAERSQRERDMALYYYWSAQQLPMLNANGVLANTEPAPLSLDELRLAMEQLVEHPDYRGQTIRSIAEDGTFIVLANGSVTVE